MYVLPALFIMIWNCFTKLVIAVCLKLIIVVKFLLRRLPSLFLKVMQVALSYGGLFNVCVVMIITV